MEIRVMSEREREREKQKGGKRRKCARARAANLQNWRSPCPKNLVQPVLTGRTPCSLRGYEAIWASDPKSGLRAPQIPRAVCTISNALKRGSRSSPTRNSNLPTPPHRCSTHTHIHMHTAQKHTQMYLNLLKKLNRSTPHVLHTRPTATPCLPHRTNFTG